jgi:hypothetical protein
MWTPREATASTGLFSALMLYSERGSASRGKRHRGEDDGDADCNEHAERAPLTTLCDMSSDDDKSVPCECGRGMLRPRSLAKYGSLCGYCGSTADLDGDLVVRWTYESPTLIAERAKRAARTRKASDRASKAKRR